jgi:hypothetical protein
MEILNSYSDYLNEFKYRKWIGKDFINFLKKKFFSKFF